MRSRMIGSVLAAAALVVACLPAMKGVPENPAVAAEQVIATAIDRAAGGEPGVPVERRPVRGEPGPVLVERARTADLLVVGSHGQRGLLGTMVGSVSQYCVDHATCPVVVVKPAA